jgi:hypothetical protein
MQQSALEYRGVTGTFRTLYSVDVDAGACEAYEQLTGSKAVNADMFSREQYIQFHGKEPPADWSEITPEDLREWAGGEIRTSSQLGPCKGFARLLRCGRAEAEVSGAQQVGGKGDNAIHGSVGRQSAGRHPV